MKRKTAVFTLVLALIMALSTVCAFADGELMTTTSAPADLDIAAAPGGLDIIDTTPADGKTGRNPQNMAVKVKFNDIMVENDAYAADSSLFHITDADGKELEFEITYNERKAPDELWLVLSGTLEPNSEYFFKADAGIASVNGFTTEKEYTTSFKTRNTKTDSYISVVMMVGMIVIMLFMTSRANKNAQEQKEAAAGKNAEAAANVNPYKIAKEKGISVEEATVIANKAKAKVSKKQARLDEKKAKQDAALQAKIAEIKEEVLAKIEAERRANNYKVKGSGSMLARGYKIPKAILRRQKAIRAKAAKKNK